MLEHVTRRRLPLPESGVEISLLDWGGEGPLALLHHANGFCAAMWDLVARPLTRHFHVIGMDARGHGDSSSPEGDEYYEWVNFGQDLAAVAAALAAEQSAPRIALGLGHSFGGTSMVMAASMRPDLFERLVLVDPVFHPPGPTEKRTERMQSLVEKARKRRRVFDDREMARQSWAGKDFFASWLPEAMDLYVGEGLRERSDGQVELKCSPDVEAAIFLSGPRFDVWGAAERVPTPTLLVWAERGDFPRLVYEGVAARMPDATIHDVPGGHLLPMERPDLVVDEVLAFCGAGQGSVG